MIQELLLMTIQEVEMSRFKITEFQLGKEPYWILKNEIEKTITANVVEISKINTFMGIPVTLHNSEDAVMYCLKLK